MQETSHKVLFADARDLKTLKDNSINLVVTSPPYPMIEMWDDLFISFNPQIDKFLKSGYGNSAFELMHLELDKIWKELFRVIKPGGFACINIGDATRSLDGRFRLYSNHSRIVMSCVNTGFDTLPEILWRKQTNAPNKFMGSGMLPSGAYVTLEHEYILIFRKNGKKTFSDIDQKNLRRESAFFWEERNSWFSDIWDFKGTRQELNRKNIRKRSAAYPFELAHRLINMYSIKGDIVLDPFLGTGTTSLAAMASQRNSIGVEIDEYFNKIIFENITESMPFLNSIAYRRLNQHIEFVEKRIQEKGLLKHVNKFYNFPVMTGQERELCFNMITNITSQNNTSAKVEYSGLVKLKDISKKLI